MSDNPNNCSICYQKHMTKAAVDWCSECEESYCAECSINHGLMKTSKHHRTIPIKDYLELKTSLNLVDSTCRTHNERYQLFCQSHDSLLCHDCLDDHVKCNKVTSLNKLTKNIKDSESLRDLKQTLADNEHNISELQKCTEGNVKQIKAKTHGLIAEVGSIRKTINDHLDEIENSFKSEINTLESQLCEAASRKLAEIKKRRANISSLKKQLEDIVRYGNDTQIFLGIQEIVNKSKDDENFVQSCLENDTVKHKLPNIELNAIVVDMADIVKLGTVATEEVSQNINLKKSKVMQAQLVEAGPKCVADIKAALTHSLNTKGRDITGCDILPDGTIVLSDHNSAGITVATADFGYCYGIPLKPYKFVYDVAVIGEKKVAASCYENVVIVDILDKSVVSAVRIIGQGYSLVHYNGSLHCCTREGIELINVQDKTITKTIKVKTSSCSYMDIFNDYYYIAGGTNKFVNCIDSDGRTIWTFQDESVIKYAWNITVDHRGYIYVVCRTLRNVVVISPDGKTSRVLLSKDNCLSSPTGLHFDKDRNWLLVAYKSDKAFLFSCS